jgi:hypothetical protein
MLRSVETATSRVQQITAQQIGLLHNFVGIAHREIDGKSTLICEFLVFRSCVTEVSLLLGYEATSLDNRFPTLRERKLALSSKADMS